MKVQLISHTPEPEKMVAIAAKLCYSPVGIDELSDNLTDKEVDRFVNILMNLGHESPVEHVNFTFGIEGVSRSLTHQLVRHRLASYSQQSQRYVRANQFEYVIPPAINEDLSLRSVYLRQMHEAQKAYDIMVNRLMTNYLNKAGFEGQSIEYIKEIHPKFHSKIEKMAIEDARYLFPNAAETKIVATMNVRTLLNFFKHRHCKRAQWEIRELATQMLKECRKVAPILFKKAGAGCLFGPCPEGKMCCGEPYIKEGN